MAFDGTDALMGLLGGLMIGTAAAIFLLMLGRIAGISGVFGALIRIEDRLAENAAFIAGLILAPLIYAFVVAPPAIGITTEVWALIVAGLLVGVGTRLGSGCTSGHGVCGIPRLSGRSISATLTFMAAGVAMATLIRPMLGLG